MHSPRSLLALLLAASVGAGCFSVNTRTVAAPRAGNAAMDRLGGVALRVYEDDGARRRGDVASATHLATALERKSGARWEPVFRSVDPSWSVMGLEPGRYRISFPAQLDDAGNAVASAERPRGIRVRAGKVTGVDATLEHVSGPLIAAGVVTAVVAAILLDDWLGDHDLPTPPLPPPPPELLEAVFWIGLDIATTPATPDWAVAGPERAPVVTSHFPEDGALVAARRLRIVFALSRPLEPGAVLHPGGAAVVGDLSGPIPGDLTYDREHAWLVWDGDGELPRGESFQVTLDADAVEPALARASDFGFRTAP